MPHVDGHPDAYGSIARSPRPRTRPANVPDIIPRPRRRPSNVPPQVAPMMGTRDPQGRIGVKGPKGGGEAAKARVEVGSDIFNQYNNDGRFGYYNDQGFYVPADIDMRDGGGVDNSGTFFEGGGFLSTLANVAKIRPYGQGDTPREQIGFRNVADMFDRGGPQASGGPYMGGGMISTIGYTLDALGGVDQGTRTLYNYDTTEPTRSDGFVANIEPRQAIPVRTIDGTPVNNAALIEDADVAITRGREPLYARSQTFNVTDRAAAIAALRRQAVDPESWDKLMEDDPKAAEELIQEAMSMQNVLYPADP